MTTVYIADRLQSLDSFILERCSDIPSDEQPALCENITKYNNYSSPGGLISRDQLIFMPDNPHQFICRGLPMAHQLTPGLNYDERRALGELLRHNTGEEVLAMAELWDQMPSDNDTFKAFAGAALGAAKSRGSEMDNAIRRYNDALVKWKNAPHHQDRQRVNMRHVKPAFDDLHRTFNREMQRIASRKRLSNPERRALRNRRRATRYLRHERNSLHLSNIADIRRLRKFLKAAKFAGWGAIIIDAGLATQKVNMARQTGGNANRIAYEEYAALAVGVAAGSAAALGALVVFGPGLLVLTLAGGVGALVGSELGRWLGRLMHDQIAAYESVLPDRRRTQILSEAALSAL